MEFGFTREERRSATSDEVARRSGETSSRSHSGTIVWDSCTTTPVLLGHICTRDSRVRSSHGIMLFLPRDLRSTRSPREYYQRRRAVHYTSRSNTRDGLKRGFRPRARSLPHATLRRSRMSGSRYGAPLRPFSGVSQSL